MQYATQSCEHNKTCSLHFRKLQLSSGLKAKTYMGQSTLVFTRLRIKALHALTDPLYASESSSEKTDSMDNEQQ